MWSICSIASIILVISAFFLLIMTTSPCFLFLFLVHGMSCMGTWNKWSCVVPWMVHDMKHHAYSHITILGYQEILVLVWKGWQALNLEEKQELVLMSENFNMWNIWIFLSILKLIAKAYYFCRGRSSTLGNLGVGCILDFGATSDWEQGHHWFDENRICWSSKGQLWACYRATCVCACIFNILLQVW
jgi:hypothetical protein